MITVENDDMININKTSRKGNIQASQANLEKVFGKPTIKGSDNKTTAEWFLQFTITENDDEQYIIATIYDWMQNDFNYEEEITWNIGGHTFEAVEMVYDYYNKHKEN